MTESEQTRKMCEFLQERGALIFAIVASRMQEPGWPDRYIAPPGVWCEFKVKNNKPTPKQRWVLEQLSLRDVRSYVVRHLAHEYVDIEDYDGLCLRAAVPWCRFIDTLKEL